VAIQGASEERGVSGWPPRVLHTLKPEDLGQQEAGQSLQAGWQVGPLRNGVVHNMQSRESEQELMGIPL